MGTIYIAFLVNTERNIDEFKNKVSKAIKPYKRYEIYFSEGRIMNIGGVVVDLSKTEKLTVA